MEPTTARRSWRRAVGGGLPSGGRAPGPGSAGRTWRTCWAGCVYVPVVGGRVLVRRSSSFGGTDALGKRRRRESQQLMTSTLRTTTLLCTQCPETSAPTSSPPTSSRRACTSSSGAFRAWSALARAPERLMSVAVLPPSARSPGAMPSIARSARSASTARCVCRCSRPGRHLPQTADRLCCRPACQDSADGVDVCLTCFNGGCTSEERHHARTHWEKSGHPMVVNIRRTRKPGKERVRPCLSCRLRER